MNAVYELRQTLGITQVELAEIAETSQPTIAAYESGRKSPTLRTYQNMALASGLEVVFQLVRTMTSEERRSLHLHRHIAEKLLASPKEVVDRAKRNLQTMLTKHAHASALLIEWERLLDQAPTEIVEAMLDRSQHARELRHVTPFAGVLSNVERAATYAAFRRLEERTT